MYYVVLVAIGFVGYFVGAFAFSQIIGSIRARQHLFAILFWTAILIASIALVYAFLNTYIWAYVIGLAISFFAVLTSGRIE